MSNILSFFTQAKNKEAAKAASPEPANEDRFKLLQSVFEAQSPREDGKNRLKSFAQQQMSELHPERDHEAGEDAEGYEEGAAPSYVKLTELLNLEKSSLKTLSYWDLYPKEIKKWIMFTKTPRGSYDDNGRWVPYAADYDLSSINTAKDTPEETERWRKLFAEEQSRLPADLRGRFRFGVTHEEIKNYHPKIMRLFSFSFASQHEILQLRKQYAIQKWKMHEFDTASDAVQIDILTQRIRSLNKHLLSNKQDKSNKRNLQLLMKRRRGLMLHLKKRDVHLYYEVLREIKLKDMYELYK